MIQSDSKPHQHYEIFQHRRDTLANLVQRQLIIASSLSMSGWEDTLQRLQERIQSDNFKVLVLGEFRRGKSTFINALLGDEILPAYAIPTTAIINEVKWGESPRALLHFNSTENGSANAPKEIPVEQIEEYVTINDGISEHEAIQENPYEKVELFWPLALCRNGVEIIDSPGLNEHEIRQKVTIDYLSTVDAILFVLSCEVLGSKSELDVIDNLLRNMGHEDLFFICNRINMIRAKERESVKQRGLSLLSPRTKHGSKRVFFVNALGALEGRLEKNEVEVEASKLPQVEEELEKFLATEKGRVKLLRPAVELQNSIYEARRVIPEQEAMLRTDFKTLEARYQEAQEPLRQLELKRQQIVAQFSNFRNYTKMLVGDRVREFYRDQVDKIPEWAKAHKLQAQINVLSLEVKPQVEKAVQELVEHLSGKVETEFAAWQGSVLQPLLINRLENHKQELDEKNREFLNQIDELRVHVSGVSLSELSRLEEISSTTEGYDGIKLPDGAVFGFKEILKVVIPQILFAFFVSFNPWLLIPAIFGGGLIQGLIELEGANEKLKKFVSQEYIEKIRASSPEQVNQLVDAVDQELGKLEDAISQGLGKEIQAVRDQANSVLAEKRKGQTNVEQRLHELAKLRSELDAIDSELDELITQIALT